MRPIASIPAIFAIHSFSSAFIWLAVQGHVSQTVGDIATAIYAVIAFVLLPIVVPLSVLAITSHSRRRQMMIVLSVAGVIAGIDFAINMIHGNTNVLACHYYLDVRVTSTLAITSTLYGVATCAVMLLSEYRPLRLWGVVNVIAVAFLYIRLENGLASIWCLGLLQRASLCCGWLRNSIDSTRMSASGHGNLTRKANSKSFDESTMIDV